MPALSLQWYKDERRRLIIENGKLKNKLKENKYALKTIHYEVKQLEKRINKELEKWEK